MGEMSVEPSMEEILSSIKRIIAEEEAPTGRRRAGRAPSPASPPDDLPDEGVDADADPYEVLELSDPMPAYPQSVPVDLDVSTPAPTMASLPEKPMPVAMPHPNPVDVRPEIRPAATSPAEPIVSPAAVDATRGALDSLSRLLVKPDPNGDGTLEGMVRDMLRPMLKEWLDARLPDMVEAMVSREIARISGQAR
ncbi:DUF2497 domain-containing protein [uncultured Sphingomonas sp.]|uniref:DUF2497 domain-containing protein n=1 Tax=uncultured Sphingomonas sp. TaxID=158754 RepID=UPI0035C9C3FF